MTSVMIWAPGPTERRELVGRLAAGEVQTANTGHQLAGISSSWCPEFYGSDLRARSQSSTKPAESPETAAEYGRHTWTVKGTGVKKRTMQNEQCVVVVDMVAVDAVAVVNALLFCCVVALLLLWALMSKKQRA